MQRILVAIDALEINSNTLNFACYIGRLTNSNITGVFLENLVAENKFKITEGYDATYLKWEPDENDPQYRVKLESIKNNIRIFEEYCSKREIPYIVLCQKGEPSKEIIKESRYADLLITDAQTSFNKKFSGSPTSFEKEILKASECPLIIAPENFKSIEEIILCYDRSRSAIFSIKQFDYILPALRQKKVTVLEVNNNKKENVSEDDSSKDWFLHHFINVHFEILHGNPKDVLYNYLLQKKNAIFIMGAYGRSSVSMLFRKTTAENILKITNLPVFIAHP